MEDLTNKKFGLLKVIGLSPIRLKCNSNKRWDCICECGGRVIVQGYNLKRGNTRSCGCLRSTKNRGRNSHTWKGYEDISASKFFEYTRNAKRRGLLFEVTMKDLWEQYLKQNKKCALTNLEITFPKTVNDITSTASLDRIDNNCGYTKNNIQWLHKEINYMKADMTTEEFIKMCKLVAITSGGGCKYAGTFLPQGKEIHSGSTSS